MQIVGGAFKTVSQGLERRMEEMEISKKKSIIMIGCNTEKSPGDARRFAVTQTPENDYQLKLVSKTLKTALTDRYNYLYGRCPWCNGYRRRKWTRRHEFQSWTGLIAFHIALIPLGKV